MKLNNSEKFTVKLLVAILLVAVGWLWLIHSAVARPMSKDECQRIAQDMYVIAQMRDQGKDEHEVELLVDRVLRPHLGEPDSYIMYETDISEMVGMVHIIYESKMSAEKIASEVYGVCTIHGYGVKY